QHVARGHGSHEADGERPQPDAERPPRRRRAGLRAVHAEVRRPLWAEPPAVTRRACRADAIADLADAEPARQTARRYAAATAGAAVRQGRRPRSAVRAVRAGVEPRVSLADARHAEPVP